MHFSLISLISLMLHLVGALSAFVWIKIKGAGSQRRKWLEKQPANCLSAESPTTSALDFETLTACSHIMVETCSLGEAKQILPKASITHFSKWFFSVCFVLWKANMRPALWCIIWWWCLLLNIQVFMEDRIIHHHPSLMSPGCFDVMDHGSSGFCQQTCFSRVDDENRRHTVSLCWLRSSRCEKFQIVLAEVRWIPCYFFVNQRWRQVGSPTKKDFNCFSTTSSSLSTWNPTPMKNWAISIHWRGWNFTDRSLPFFSAPNGIFQIQLQYRFCSWLLLPCELWVMFLYCRNGAKGSASPLPLYHLVRCIYLSQSDPRKPNGFSFVVPCFLRRKLFSCWQGRL